MAGGRDGRRARATARWDGDVRRGACNSRAARRRTTPGRGEPPHGARHLLARVRHALAHRGWSRMAAVMLQGTGSDVGKSVLVAGLCRLFTQRGLRVLPFKPQNMSNNAAVAVDGGEIGRAQAVQARAARLLPSVHMNPVLLKPETDTGAQVIVQGRRLGTLQARDFAGSRKTDLMPAVLDSFARLSRDCDIVLVEGAGSPAEINLRAGEIANMGFATAADVPVLLAGDIDRGGVIASIVGTHAVLE